MANVSFTGPSEGSEVNTSTVLAGVRREEDGSQAGATGGVDGSAGGESDGAQEHAGCTKVGEDGAQAAIKAEGWGAGPRHRVGEDGAQESDDGVVIVPDTRPPGADEWEYESDGEAGPHAFLEDGTQDLGIVGEEGAQDSGRPGATKDGAQGPITSARKKAGKRAARGDKSAVVPKGKAAFAPKGKKKPPPVVAQTPGPQDWKRTLTRNARGGLLATKSNMVTIIAHDPMWEGILVFDSFTERIMKERCPKWHKHDKPTKEFRRAGPWTDADTILLSMWFERHYDFVPRGEDVRGAILTASRTKAYHPVRDWLKSIVWDGAPRLDKWLVKYGGAVNTPYVRAIGAKWMIAAVARVFRPGCKVDSVLIFEGKQGIGKSTMLRVIAHKDAWFYVDVGSELGEKDSYQKIEGKWIVEMSELDSLNRSELSRVKAFITDPIPRYRSSYGHTAADHPLQSILAGSTNKEKYLQDDTGNRRFWPVRLRKVDLAGLEIAHEQLWGEAVVRYLAGEAWHLVESEIIAAAEEQQASRMQDDPWGPLITKMLCSEIVQRQGITTYEILSTHIGIPSERIDRKHEMRVASILSQQNWYSRQIRIGGREGPRSRRYFPQLQASSESQPRPKSPKSSENVVSLLDRRKS
jgi:predicted P-loop ATPase